MGSKRSASRLERRAAKVPWRRAWQSTPVFLPGDSHGQRSLDIGKDPDAGRDWGQEEEGTTEDEIAGWHHRPNGHEFELPTM